MRPPGTPPVSLRHERDRRPGRVWRRPGQTGLWQLHRHGLGSRRRGRKSVRWDCWTDSRGRPTACGAGHQRTERSPSPSGGRPDEGHRARRGPGQRQVDPVHGRDARGLARRPSEPRRGSRSRSAGRRPDADGAIGEDRLRAGAVRRRAREASRARRASPGCARPTRWRSWCGASGAGASPASELAEVRADLLLADLAVVEAALQKAEKKARGKPGPDVGALRVAKDALDAETPLRSAGLSPEDAAVLRGFAPLTLKPEVVIANLEEGSSVPDELGDAVGVYAAIEAEVAEMEPAEARALLEEFGVDEPGLESVIAACYRALDLITFLTTGDDETRAWEVRHGATAPEAAGSDPYRSAAGVHPCGGDQLRRAGRSRVHGRRRKPRARCGSKGRTTWCRKGTSCTSGSRSNHGAPTEGDQASGSCVPCFSRRRSRCHQVGCT